MATKRNFNKLKPNFILALGCLSVRITLRQPQPAVRFQVHGYAELAPVRNHASVCTLLTDRRVRRRSSFCERRTDLTGTAMTTTEHNSLRFPGSSKNKHSGNSKKVHVYQAHLPHPFSPLCKVICLFFMRKFRYCSGFSGGNAPAKPLQRWWAQVTTATFPPQGKKMQNTTYTGTRNLLLTEKHLAPFFSDFKRQNNQVFYVNADTQKSRTENIKFIFHRQLSFHCNSRR